VLLPTLFVKQQFFDFKPDICKDYKETGYCGYGDSCKFIHDRSDYKSGWQIDAEYERNKTLQVEGQFDDDDDEKYVIKSSDSEEDENECHICNKELENDSKNIVKSKCGHLFHESCALKYFKKSSKCFVCRKETHGIFGHKT